MPSPIPWRRLAIAIALVFSLFQARAAHADPEASLEVPFDLKTHAVSHEGTASDGRIAWHTTLVDNVVDGARVGRPFVVRLARPLLPGTVLVGSQPPGAWAKPGNDGAIVAFVFDDVGGWPAKIVIDTLQPVDPSDATLAPPVVAGETPQVITLSGADGHRFEADAALDLVRHVGFLAPDDVDSAARRDCAELTGARGLPHDAEAIYVRGTSPIVSRIHGRITTSSQRNRGGLVGAGLAFVVCGVALALLYRRLTASADIERADAALRADYEQASDPRRHDCVTERGD